MTGAKNIYQIFLGNFHVGFSAFFYLVDKLFKNSYCDAKLLTFPFERQKITIFVKYTLLLSIIKIFFHKNKLLQ